MTEIAYYIWAFVLGYWTCAALDWLLKKAGL